MEKIMMRTPLGRIGDPSEVANITDIWTFSRQVKSRDPNWVLTATESPQ